MVTITQESTATHYSNIEQEDGVLQAYDSIGSLIDDIKMNSGGMFEALSLVGEVNRLNEYKVIGEYEVRNIKDHFRENRLFSIESHSVRDKSGLSESSFSKKENENIESNNRQRGFIGDENSKMRDLRKGYMKLLSV